jgi:capsular polysaccharide transport system permease protein
LGQRRDAGDVNPSLYCGLAERLLHEGRRDEAAECCRHAFPRIDDAEMLRLCAWVFSNSECHEEAAAAYRALLDLDPDWVEGYRHASGALAACGRLDDAIAAAIAATARAPDNAEFALHAANLLRLAGLFAEALQYLDSAAAALTQPHNPLAVDLAELLMQCGRADQAAALLYQAAGDTAAARLWRVLSAAEMLRDRLDAALTAIDRAIETAPDCAEYHIHRAHLLWRLDDLGGASAALDRAATLDPTSGDVRRAQLSLYLAAGLVTEATAIGGDLLRRFPDDRPAAEAVLHLLSHRLDTIDGDYVVLGDRLEPMARPPRPVSGWPDRLRTQCRVIGALIIRETRTRFGDSKLGYGWALIEPILHISLLSATFSVLMHGQPPIGSHFFIFYYTGLIPYLIFIHTSSGMSHSIVSNAALLQLPPVTTFDVIAARGLLEIATDIVVAVILLVGFGAIGLSAVPDDLWEPSMALLATAAFGCGCGFINAVVTVFCRSWDKTYSQVTRLLYFISGIFYVPGMMPDWVRDLLAWNPLLHAIDWFRSGFFAAYQPHWLDRSYLSIAAILTLAGGFALERGMRRRLSVPL